MGMFDNDMIEISVTMPKSINRLESNIDIGVNKQVKGMSFEQILHT